MKPKLFILAFLAIGLFTESCEKKVQIQEVEVCTESEKSDNLVAFFHPFAQTIYILPHSTEKMTAVLNLIPLSDEIGLYEYSAFTTNGDPIILPILLEETTLDAILEISELADAELEALIAVEETGDEVISTSKTYSGYKCKLIDNGRLTRCHVFSNYSSRTEQFDRYLCRASYASDHCTEWKTTIGNHLTYDNRDCEGEPKKTRIVAFSCM